MAGFWCKEKHLFGFHIFFIFAFQNRGNSPQLLNPKSIFHVLGHVSAHPQRRQLKEFSHSL